MSAITAEQKGQIVKDYQRAVGDTGSPEVQVALLSARITHLTDHFSTHKQDHHSRQGLLVASSATGCCTSRSPT